MFMTPDTAPMSADTLRPILLVGAIMAVTLVGDYFLKLASQQSQPALSWPCLLGVMFYGATALIWVEAMGLASLAALGVYYAVMTVVGMAVLGVFMFGEELRPREILGIGFAVASIILMSRFAD